MARRKPENKRLPNAVDRVIGERIKLARTETGISQERLGAKLNVTFQQVQKYEAGKNRVAASRLLQIARVFDKPVTWFLEAA